MKRREFLAAAGAGALVSALPFRWTEASWSKPRKILYFTRSAGFEHSVVARKGKDLAHSERLLTEWCKEVNVEVVCSKDGGVFDGDLDQFDAIALYATGDWTRPVDRPNEPPATETGVKRLLDAIAAGKGVIGFHAANDAFHSRGSEVSPFVKMIGGEFLSHGRQQEATIRVASPKFPGCQNLGESFRMLEEWYAMKNLADDLHVILIQDTEGMVDACYQRPPYPSTWARMHGKGRVFYTSLGHREDVWESKIMKDLTLGALAWVLGEVAFDPVPNIKEVTPGANQLTR
ncbi:putative glycosyl hydrolase (putative secreted protein) [Thermogutta terrifontis]|jgi:type 1 glutamine amidotransferase|uniref:Putative glycosyl hydrolase (Putative secreted protein) n=1 Tax=Thermogutta terrifontis TaxID=1331910 RepID=A0A286RDC3_9BACT|nr:ThuA domain-containing protein [Thermogutta terrifontis]ASV73965.1 putative glycosyl hydrolase (putative secreted protein) [Thermogutta terrifontis]